jgi:hypothetical protein
MRMVRRGSIRWREHGNLLTSMSKRWEYWSRILLDWCLGTPRYKTLSLGAKFLVWSNMLLESGQLAAE